MKCRNADFSGWCYWHPIGGLQEDTFAMTPFMTRQTAAAVYCKDSMELPSTTLRRLRRLGGKILKVRLEIVQEKK